MDDERFQRKLAAILAADVVGYARLIRADEEGTLSALNSLRKDIIDPKVAEHHGRIVKLMGDGMLVEFASVVDAVTCVVAIQTGMAERASDVFELLRAQVLNRRVELGLDLIVGLLRQADAAPSASRRIS